MEGIPSPLGPLFKPRVNATVNVEMRQMKTPKMLDHLATLALIIVGVGAYAVSELEGIAGIVGNVAFVAWIVASVEAILEHIKRPQEPEIPEELKAIIGDIVKGGGGAMRKIEIKKEHGPRN